MLCFVETAKIIMETNGIGDDQQQDGQHAAGDDEEMLDIE